MSAVPGVVDVTQAIEARRQRAIEQLGLTNLPDDPVLEGLVRLAARTLRNRMVHEYQPAPEDLLQALQAARQLVPHFVATYNAINQRLASSMGIGENWPDCVAQ